MHVGIPSETVSHIQAVANATDAANEVQASLEASQHLAEAHSGTAPAPLPPPSSAETDRQASVTGTEGPSMDVHAMGAPPLTKTSPSGYITEEGLDHSSGLSTVAPALPPGPGQSANELSSGPVHLEWGVADGGQEDAAQVADIARVPPVGVAGFDIDRHDAELQELLAREHVRASSVLVPVY